MSVATLPASRQTPDPCPPPATSHAVTHALTPVTFVTILVRDCCTFAARDGFEWIWIDTCCIDKTSSSELSEAINSMYAWYAAADVCYVWLHDVDDIHPSQSGPTSFSRSAWFTRGWTLQELLAPRYVVFLSKKWHTLGTKQTLGHRIKTVTGISEDVLSKTVDLHAVSVARRMSWAATRRTTRDEDLAYSLMGIFDVNMPTIYGEVFVFRSRSSNIPKELRDSSLRSLLAPSPAEFEHSRSITPISLDNLSELLEQPDLAPPEYTTTAYGMRTAFPIVNIPSLGRDLGISVAILACQDDEGLVVLFLSQRRSLWTSAPQYLVYRVGADLYPNVSPSRSSEYHRLGRIHVGARADRSFLTNLAVHPLFIEYNPISVKSSLRGPPSPNHRSNRMSYAFFFPAWLLESGGITATLDGHQTIEHEDGIMVEFTPDGPTQRTIIFARDPPPSPSSRSGNVELQGIRLSMFSHCSCEANPLRHPMSIAIDLMVPEHDSSPGGHPSSGTHRRCRSLNAILKDNHQVVQSRIPGQPTAHEDQVEGAWHALGRVSIGLKRWNGCHKTKATYVYIVEITNPYRVMDPERQASLPTYTHAVVPETGVIVYPAVVKQGKAFWALIVTTTTMIILHWQIVPGP
ncbi:hypothetical protein V8D89_016147 [Ganoderma adspersum]